jgi:cytochrome b6-f complex iron-sulfur subunit
VRRRLRDGETAEGADGVLPGRRAVLRGIWIAGAALLSWAWGSLSVDRRRRTRARRVTIPAPTTDGVSFHGDVILVSRDGRLTALDAHCPHLGCRIDRAAAGELVCPCHGSRFDAAGKRTGGPAAGDLRVLPVAPSKREREVDVELAG